MYPSNTVKSHIIKDYKESLHNLWENFIIYICVCISRRIQERMREGKKKKVGDLRKRIDNQQVGIVKQKQDATCTLSSNNFS